MIIGLIIPPPYPDGQWWGTFLTSAGFGGSLAVVGASTAAAIAFHNSRSDRRQKQDADGWFGLATGDFDGFSVVTPAVREGSTP